MSSTPLKVAVTGAAGQIGYSLLFRLASGALLGDRPIELRLLEITRRSRRWRAWSWRSTTARSRTWPGSRSATTPRPSSTASTWRCSWAPAPHRGDGARRPAVGQRRDLHRAGQGPQQGRGRRRPHRGHRQPGQHQRAHRDVNTPDIPQERFTALTRLDHNRAISQLSAKTGAAVTDIKQMTIWGNHSATQYPTSSTPRSVAATPRGRGRPGGSKHLHPDRRQRARPSSRPAGSSSAASAASATIDAARDWLFGSAEGDWVSMAVASDGSYGVPEGLISRSPSSPATAAGRSSRAWRSTTSPAPDRRLHRRARRRARRSLSSA